MKQILIVEDDKRLGPVIQKGLREQEFDAILAPDGKSAQNILREGFPGLIILDLGLPDCDGIEILGMIRKQGYRDPVLILTARDGLTDKVKGLDSGADDYLVKPFAFAELLARIRALMRRSVSKAKKLLVGNLTIDLVTRHVVMGEKPIDLTPREFDILAYLADHAGQIVSRDMLSEYVWRESGRFTSLDNVIDVHVSRLRRKLTDDTGVCPLRVIRGQGIMLGDAV